MDQSETKMRDLMRQVLQKVGIEYPGCELDHLGLQGENYYAVVRWHNACVQIGVPDSNFAWADLLAQQVCSAYDKLFYPAPPAPLNPQPNKQIASLGSEIDPHLWYPVVNGE